MGFCQRYLPSQRHRGVREEGGEKKKTHRKLYINPGQITWTWGLAKAPTGGSLTGPVSINSDQGPRAQLCCLPAQRPHFPSTSRAFALLLGSLRGRPCPYRASAGSSSLAACTQPGNEKVPRVCTAQPGQGFP